MLWLAILFEYEMSDSFLLVGDLLQIIRSL